MPLQAPSTTVIRRGRAAACSEQGFTLIEMLLAMVILAILVVGIGSVLTSAIAATTVARERTGAEQCANRQAELVRSTAYDKIGTPSGNPPGVISATAACDGVLATANLTISYVNDPTPTSYATAANYKRVTIRIVRDRDSKLLLRTVTYVAPPARAPYGGINNAIINVQVVDVGNSQPYSGATVSLTNGPSPSRSDTSDTTGSVSFAALTPNPTSGPQAYYDLSVSAPGYETIPADLPPGTATPPMTASHIQLAPSQTSATSVRIFKPATINVILQDSGGAAYTGGATLKVMSSFTGATSTVAVAAGQSTKSITTLGGQSIVSGATYTLHGYTTSGLCADPAPSPVPASGYPTTTSQTFTLVFTSCPMGSLDVNAQQLGENAPCAPVVLSGGPNDISLSGTTDGAGNVSFPSVPAGGGYQIDAGARFGQNGSTTASVTAGSTTNKTVTLADPATGSLTVAVTDAGQNVGPGVPVMLGGGSCGIAPRTVTTDGSGNATFSNVPVGTGFPAGAGLTAAVSYAGITGSVAVPSISSGSNSASLMLPTGTVAVTVTWAGAPAGNTPSAGTVSITGGPFGSTYTGSTDASGVATILAAPTSAAYPYTVTASKNGSAAVSGSAVTSLAQGGTATSAVALTPTKTFVITIHRNGTAAANTAISISITGGPNGNPSAPPAYTFSLTTNSSGVLPAVTVPRGSSGSTYSIKANLTTCGASGSNRSGSRTGQNNSASSTSVTVNMRTSTCPFSPLP